MYVHMQMRLCEMDHDYMDAHYIYIYIYIYIYVHTYADAFM